MSDQQLLSAPKPISYSLAEVTEALGNKEWPSPIIIVPPHYFISKPDGQYVKYMRPPWSEDEKALIDDFVVKNPHSTPPPTWDDIQVNLKALAPSYEQAQKDAIIQARKSITAFRRKQAAAAAKAKKQVNGESCKKSRITAEYPPGVTTISSFVQGSILPKAFSTPKATAQNIPHTVTSGALQDDAQNITLYSSTGQRQDSSVPADKLREAIMAVPGMDVLLEQDASLSNDEIRNAIMTVPGLEEMLPSVGDNSGTSNLEVNVHQDSSGALTNSTGPTSDHSYPEILDENQYVHVSINQGDQQIEVTHEEVVSSVPQNQSMGSVYSSPPSSALLLPNNDEDCFVTKKDLKEFKTELLTDVEKLFYQVLSKYFEKKYGKTFTAVEADLKAVKVGVMERIPLAELNNVIPLDDLKMKFGLSLPMTTQEQFDKFESLLVANYHNFYHKVKEHITATTSSKLDVLVSMRMVIKKFLGKEAVALFTSSRPSSKSTQKSIFKDTKFYACLLDAFMQMYNKPDKTGNIVVKVVDADFATNVGTVFNGARSWGPTLPAGENGLDIENEE